MPTLETQFLDAVIVSRRSLLAGSAAMAALTLVPKQAAAQANVAAYSDNDILNFALNLEYLESNFYYLAAFGTTIDVGNAASTAASAPVNGINGVTGGNASGSTAGVVANAGISGAPALSTYKVPFATPVLGAYAVETAVEEGKHVAALRAALGSLAVAQPSINLTPGLFDALAGLAGVPSALRPFNPYANEAYFLLGAYIFEDVGVSAYHGAAPLITGKTTILPVAAGILAVEAYHAGLVRTSLAVADNNATYAAAGTLASVTGLLSTFRNSAAQAKAQVPLQPGRSESGRLRPGHPDGHAQRHNRGLSDTDRGLCPGLGTRTRNCVRTQHGPGAQHRHSRRRNDRQDRCGRFLPGRSERLVHLTAGSKLLKLPTVHATFARAVGPFFLPAGARLSDTQRFVVGLSSMWRIVPEDPSE